MISRARARTTLMIAGLLLALVLVIILRPRPGMDSRGTAQIGTAYSGASTAKSLKPFVPALAGGDSLGSLRKAAENGALVLYLDPDTTEVAIKNKSTGAIWYSNPPLRQGIEKIAQGEGLDELGSQFIMSYYRQQRSESLDHPTVLMKHIRANNRAESVKYNQFKIYGLENGIRIEYVVGKAWEFEDYIPKLISKERFERLILNRVAGAEDRQILLDNYVPVAFVKADAGNRIPLTELDKRKLFGDYTLIPLSEEYQRKVGELAAGGDGTDGEPSFAREQLDDERRSITMDFVNIITENRQGGIGLNQLKPQDFARFRDRVIYYLNSPPKFLRISMAEIIQKAKYTPLDAQEDCRRNGIDAPMPDPGVFTIPLEYCLDGENLVARIPCREISYPRDVVIKDVGELNEKVTFPLESIGMLPYFGAADPTQQGDILIPDGSGVLIHLNNGKTNAGGYIAPVYGRDNSSEPRRSERLTKRTVHLPVFGMRQGTRAFLGIIEEGAALAKIRAEVAGRINSYNSVSAEFTTMPVATVGFGAVSVTDASIANEEEGVSTVYPKRLYQGDIKIRYAFLDGKDAGYVGMAKYYRGYMMKTAGLTRLTPASDLPFFLELIGSIPVKKPVMGINKDVMEPLTTFTQAAQIARYLFAGGIGNLKLEYNGILRGGVEHEYPAKVRLAGELGKKQDLARLNNQLKTYDSQLFPKVNLINVYRVANGFNKDTDAARYLNRLPARIFAYNRATFMFEPGTEQYIVSPAKLDDLVGGFLKGYRGYSVGGLSVGVMGEQLNGDYRENTADLIDRQQSLGYTIAQYKKLKDNDLDVLVNGANDYVLPYIRNVSQTPMDSSHESIIDEDVPFYQIVLHGLVNLAGEPLNLADDYRGSFLKALETGCSPYYRWFYRESSLVKNTRFADLYACHYRDWMPDALRLYREADTILGGLQDRLIVGHERLMDGVFRTTYDNGQAVLVNYGTRPVVVDGITVRARGYALQAFAM